MKRLLLLPAAILIASCAVKFQPPAPPEKHVRDVCPLFHLKDEDGNVINPVMGENAGKPYSPRQTCGGCHDYDLIVEGYHFQQGRGEANPKWLSDRYAWVTGPGNYGGRW